MNSSTKKAIAITVAAIYGAHVTLFSFSWFGPLALFGPFLWILAITNYTHELNAQNPALDMAYHNTPAGLLVRSNGIESMKTNLNQSPAQFSN